MYDVGDVSGAGGAGSANVNLWFTSLPPRAVWLLLSMIMACIVMKSAVRSSKM